MAEDTGLEAYLQTHKSKRGGVGNAWCCHVPPELLAQIEAAVAQGSKRWRDIAHWLTEQGVEGVTAQKLQYHFERHV